MPAPASVPNLSLTVDQLVKDGVISEHFVGSHHNIIRVELPVCSSLRQGLTLMEKLWRPEGAFADGPHERNIRLMVFSGEMNGRQMPNKSESHGTILTDQVYRVSVKSDRIDANVAGANASQQIGRINGVQQHVLNKMPTIWCTEDTQAWVLEHHRVQHELCDLVCELQQSNEVVNIHDVLQGIQPLCAINHHSLYHISVIDHDKVGCVLSYTYWLIARLFPNLLHLVGGSCGLDRAKYPTLSTIKDRVDSKTSETRMAQAQGKRKNATPPCVKTVAIAPKHARIVGMEMEQMATPMGQAPCTPPQNMAQRVPRTLMRPSQFNAAAKGRAPENPAIAQEWNKKQRELREASVLTSLKSATKNVLFAGQGRNESGMDAWRVVVTWYAEHHRQLSDEVPDFSAELSDGAMAQLVESCAEGVRSEVRKLFIGGHRFQGCLLGDRVCDTSPGGLFKRTAAGWEMEDFMQAKLDTLVQRRSTGNTRRNIRDLWLGTKQGKGAKVIRNVFKKIFGELVADDPGADIQSPDVWPFLGTVTRSEIHLILDKWEYQKQNLGHFAATPGPRQAWSVPVVVGRGDRFKLTQAILEQIKEAAGLTLDNLHSDD